MAANAYIAYYYSYDAANRLTGVTDSLGRSIDYQYDAAGNRVSMTSPGGQTTSYTYNDAGRISSISNYAGTFTFSYDNNGRRTGLAYPNGTTATYSYDANGNLTGIVHSKSGATIAQSLYTYDNVNNRITKTDTQTATYTYDAIYRLTNSTQGEAYSYDAVGNRLTGPAAETYSYNAGNELTSSSTGTYTYDANGNRITKSDGTTYAYDDENRLVQVNNGTNVITYTYDPFGRRIEKNINGVITQYLYDQESIILEYENGSITARYTHGLNIDEPLAIEKSGQTYYYHADGLRSIIALTNNSSSKVQGYTYDSFGNVTQSGGIIQPFTYTAREYDTETGFYFYRARYYDPTAGRFITKDPIGFDGGDINLYAYVRNNPLNKIDPFGLAVVGGGIGYEGMLLIGYGKETHWCCDGKNLWMVRTRKWCFGLGGGYSGGGSLTVGNPKNCPSGYGGVTVEAALGPISGDNSPGSDWHNIGAGWGYIGKIFVICINTFTEPPQKVGCCGN